MTNDPQQSASPALPLVAPEDISVVREQLGRLPRGVLAVAHRCPCGCPDVIETAPRLPDGTPFPTVFYLTCPRASAECGRLESAGVMARMTERLASDVEFAAGYAAAHRDYLARREAIEAVECLRGVSAGGMPDRVKCLHVHLAHALAAGRGVNPVGDEVIDLIGPWWESGSCGTTDGMCP